MKEKEEEKEILIENLNEYDNMNDEQQEQNEKSSDIDQINNIENIKNDNLNRSEDSFSSEDSDEKLKKIFGKYNSNIKSLIYTNPPNKEDVFLVLIFQGTLDFVKKYIYFAQRKDTFIEDNINKEEDDNNINSIELKEKEETNDDVINEIELNKVDLIKIYENDKNKFRQIFENKMEQTHKFIKVIKNVFKELDKTEDKLIEKIIFYYGENKVDKSLLRHYYELTFEDFIFIFSCIVNYFTGLEIKLELRNSSSKDVFLLLFCNGEETYEKLADIFDYELQLKPYALNYRNESEKNNNSININKTDLSSSDTSNQSLGYTKTIIKA